MSMAAEEAASIEADDGKRADLPAAEANDDAQGDESWEDQAARMGWKADFKGPHAVDAETFVKRGREMLPILQANNKALEKAVAKANSELKGLKDTFKEFQKHHSATEQRAYERAKADLEAKLEEHAEVGDVAGVKRVSREISDLDKEASGQPKKQEGDPNAATPEFNEAFEPWKAENAWFDKDRAMTAYAVEIYGEQPKGASEEDKLAAVAKAVKSEFAHKFENPRRREAAAVEGNGAARRTGRTFSDLPADAKAQCDRFVAKGLITREQYVKDFAWS